MSSSTIDVAVIGAGVIGAAVANKLAERGLDVLLLEAQKRACTGISSRNSGVIHSGLYYRTDSLKARSCIRGQALLYEWCERFQVPHRRTGKLVVGDVDGLEELWSNATENGAKGCRLLGARKLRALEPSLANHSAALFCGFSGIVDAHAYTASLIANAKNRGAVFTTSSALHAVGQGAEGWILETARGSIQAQQVVNAAGLYADEVAALFGVQAPTVHLCRGDYFRWRTQRSFKHLIYPVKKSAQRGLGVHLTLELDGALKLGPDAQYVDSKDDFGAAEQKLPDFVLAAERLFGAIEPKELSWDSCGIRPKLRGPEDSEERDFVILEDPPGVIHMLGIESPGLTASLALAECVEKRL